MDGKNTDSKTMLENRVGSFQDQDDREDMFFC